VLVLVHVVRMFFLTDEQDAEVILAFAFIPARYDPAADYLRALYGGFGADLWSFFTYAFLHADWLHVGLNLAWLLPFGTALARRFGAWRYIAFMLVVAAAGAFAHLITHAGAMVPMIGASAAISGAMAAAMRFVFQPDGPVARWRERFLAHRDEVVRLYDQRFVRMWEFYLACSEMAFREGDMVVFQIQIAKRKGLAPATRDYIAREEARLRGIEAGYSAPLRLAGE